MQTLSGDAAGRGVRPPARVPFPLWEWIVACVCLFSLTLSLDAVLGLLWGPQWLQGDLPTAVWSQAQLLRTSGPDSQTSRLTPGGEEAGSFPHPPPGPVVRVMVLLPQSELSQGPAVATSGGPRAACGSHQNTVSPARHHRHPACLRAGGGAAHARGPRGHLPAQAGEGAAPPKPQADGHPSFPSCSPTVPAVLVQRACRAEGLDGQGALPGLCLRLPRLLR